VAVETGDAAEDAGGLVELARLEALRRVALGAAHTLNNALTGALGELAFLRDERKDDPSVVEACEAIARELERCVRAAAALQPARPARGLGAVDLVRAARDAAARLRPVLGRRAALEITAPDDLVLVEADAGDLDLLVVLLIQAGVERAGRAARLALAVERAPDGGPQLALAASAPAAEPGAAQTPGGGSGALARALRALALCCGGRFAEGSSPQGGWRAEVSLRAAR